MEIIEYITGQGGFILMAFAVIVIVLFRKIKQRRDIRSVTKKRK